jgi:hypothetical protein
VRCACAECREYTMITTRTVATYKCFLVARCKGSARGTTIGGLATIADDSCVQNNGIEARNC